MAGVFVSYKSDDREKTRPLVDALRRAGVPIWWDRDIGPGQPWEKTVQEALGAARCVIVCWTKSSIDPNDGAMVQTEAREAQRAGKLLQVCLEPVEAPLFFRNFQAVDLHDWDGSPFDPRFQSLAQAARDILAGKNPTFFSAPPKKKRPIWPVLAGAGAVAVAALVAWLLLRPPPPTPTTIPATIEITGGFAATGENSFRDCDQCPEMRVLESGEYLMGARDGETGRQSDEGPQHNVRIAQVAVGRFEVTLDQWKACRANGGCGSNGDFHLQSGEGDQPVVFVSWDDAQEYVTWLSAQTRRQYRLLSEAEWEYAARGGTRTAWSWGDDPNQVCIYGNTWDHTAREDAPVQCDDGVGERTASVGRYRPNQFGLFDMTGNAWEWVQDCYSATYRNLPINGAANESVGCSAGRVLRGGSWKDGVPYYTRSAARDGPLVPSHREDNIGFRVATSMIPSAFVEASNEQSAGETPTVTTTAVTSAAPVVGTWDGTVTWQPGTFSWTFYADGTFTQSGLPGEWYQEGTRVTWVYRGGGGRYVGTISGNRMTGQAIQTSGAINGSFSITRRE